MEPDVQEFLIRIMQTISMGVVWLLINMSVGIYFGPSPGNYIFYVWFLLSFTGLIFYFRKKWKGWKEIGE
jgi:hypothetical protein